MANNTYYSPFFPAADERGAKGTTIAAVPSAVVSEIRDKVDIIQENIDNGTIGAADDIPPAIPTNLVLASAISDTGATLTATWTAPSDADLAGYDFSVKEGDSSYIDFTTTTPRYELKALRRGAVVTAKVRAFDKAGNRSSYTAEVSLTTARDSVPPAKPTGLATEAAFTTINFVWTSPVDADVSFVKVRMFNSIDQNISMRDVNVVPGAQGNTVFTGLQKGTLYKFTAEAYDTSGNASGQTAFHTAMTPAGVDLNDLTPGLQPIKTVSTLPSPSGYAGPSIVFNQADGKLYRYVNGAWKSTGDDIDTSDFVTNTNLVNYKIGDNNLNPGVIKSDNLVAGAVTLDKIGSDIVLGTTNLVRNSNALGASWTFGASGGASSLPIGFSPYNNGEATEPSKWTVVNSAGWSGGNAILVEFSTNASTKGVYLADVAGLSNANIMKPNKTYMVSVYVRATGGAVGKNVHLSYNIPPAQYIPVAYPALTNEYQRYVFRLVQGASVDPQLFYTISGSISNTASSIMFSDFQIEEASIVSAYSPALIPGEIGGAYLAEKAITRSKIADLAIGTNQIESLVTSKLSGQITETQISDNSISTGKIATNAITSDKINAGAVNADKIAANSISANKLSIATRPFSLFAVRFAVGVDGNLTWNSGYVQYTDSNGAYVSTFVGAGSVAGGQAPLYFYYAPGQSNFTYTFDETVQNNQSVFFVGKWHGTKNGFIASSGVGTLINGDQLITGSLHANRITAETITGDKIAASTIVGDKIAAGTILAGNIAADAITSDKIKSNSIRATHLMIGDFDQLNPDPLFRDTTFWYNNGKYNGPLSTGSDYRGWYNIHGSDIDSSMGYRTYCMLWAAQFGLASGERQHLFSNTSANIQPNTVYQLSARVRNASNQIIHVYIRQLRADGSYIQDATLSFDTLSSAVVKSVQFTSHAETRQYQFIIFNNADNAFNGNVQVSDVQVVKAAVGTTIADGVITTGKIAADAITADKIAANSIAANKLTISTKPVALYNIRFRVENDGRLYWSDGYVQYVKADGTYVSEYCAAASKTAEYPMHYIYYTPGSGFMAVGQYEQIQADQSVFQIAQWNGTKSGLSVRAGVGTLINGDQLITGSVNADRIVARSIGADRIAAGTLTANEIAANTITANKLVLASRPISTAGLNMRIDTDGVLRWDAGSVIVVNDQGTTNEYTVSAGNAGGGWPIMVVFVPGRGYFDVVSDRNVFLPNAGHIKIADRDGLSDLKTYAGVGMILSGDRIVTGSIQATKIVANSITTNQIAANTITANNIAAGTITAAQIATGALTARVIATGNPDSIVGDNGFNDPMWWSSGVDDRRLTVGETGMKENRRELLITPNGGIDVYSYFFAAEPGATYRVNYGVYTYGNFSGKFRPMIHMPGMKWAGIKARGESINPDSQSDSDNFTAAEQYASGSFILTNGVSPDQGKWQFRIAGGFTGSCAFTINIVRVSDTTLIKDGAITTDKITVGTLNADRLLAGSITADKIKANAISTNQLSLGLQSRVINNLLNTSFWANSPISSVAGWSENNSSANYWAHIIAPGGGSEVALRMIANGPNGNGGWDVSIPRSEGFSTDKAYRYYTWYLAENDGVTNSIYHGINNVQHMQGGDADNPYFFSFDKNSLQRGKWYLLVGYVHPANTGAGQSGLSGVYDPVTGQRVIAGNDFRWRPTANEGTFRSYQFYGAVGGIAWFTKPVVEEVVQGQTPSIKSLMQDLDYGSVVNAGSTLIRPGLIQISGGTTIENWKNGGNSTEIRGGALAANTITANKLTIGNRGINIINLQFEVSADKRYLYWNSGHVSYQDDNGTVVTPYVAGGGTDALTRPDATYYYVYWVKGSGYLDVAYDDPAAAMGDNKILLCTWTRGSSRFNANYGGTIIHGDQITTGTINANRIVAGSILTDTIQIGGTGNTLADSLKMATWANVVGNGKPADGATVGGTLGSNIYDGGALVSAADVRNNMDGFIRSPGGGVFTTQQSVFAGALKVRLPVGFTNTMIKFVVDIYEYEAGYSCTLAVGGYTYDANGGTWINVSASVTGGSNVEYPVFFGRDSDGFASVWIGENNTSWSYPQVTVRDVIVGYSNVARTTWEKNWQIGFQNRGFTNVAVYDTYPAADWRKVTGSGKPADNATVGAPSGTYVGNKLAQTVVSELDNILSDGVLSRNEKPEMITRWNAYYQDWRFVRDAAANMGVNYSALDTAYYAASDYLVSIQPGWADVNTDSPINAAHLRNLFNNLDGEMAEVRRTTSNTTATRATWGGVSGSGKPADNATVGAPEGTYVGNKLAQVVASSIDAITSDNIVSPVEKTVLYNQYRQVHEEEYYLYIMATKFVNDGKGNRYGVEGQRDQTRIARNTFISYLDNLGMFADVQASTNVDGNALRAYYNSYVASANALKEMLNNLTAEAANWDLVSGSGKPANNATVGAPAGTYVGNTEAQQVTNWAYTGQQDPVGRINAGVTTISGGKITTGSIEALQIAANTITANKLNITSLSAITANIGNLVSYNGSGGRVERDGNGSRIYDNSGRLRMRWGFW